MARKTKELSALEVGRIKLEGYHHVGGVAGLVLQVTKSGTKSWLMRVLVGGKRREIGLGGYCNFLFRGPSRGARAGVGEVTPPVSRLERATLGHAFNDRRHAAD